MSIVKWNPFWEIDEFDRFFEGGPMARPASFIPSIDVYQDKENVIVETPLAGIDPEKVSISIENDVLTIEGKTEKKSEVEEKEYYRKEVRYGSFHRAVALPASVKGDKAKAVYEKGLLKITIPKEEKIKPKKVKVEIKE
jgi:HSP20 family protein